MLLLVAYGQRDPSTYYFNRHLEHSFTQGFSAVLSFKEFFIWANTTLVSNLYSHYPGTLPSPQDMCQPPCADSFLGTGVGHCHHHPYRELITTGPYALKERPSKGCVYTREGLMQSGGLPK